MSPCKAFYQERRIAEDNIIYCMYNVYDIVKHAIVRGRTEDNLMYCIVKQSSMLLQSRTEDNVKQCNESRTEDNVKQCKREED